jgi:CIC family chloride channel protein
LALHRKRPTVPLTETFSHLLSSALAVGCGGSAGLEAPSVLTGAAIGANTGSFFFVAKKRRALLLGCGASAAIAAIFDSPIA